MKILDSVIGFFAPQDDEGYENEPVRETRYERKEREPREVRDRDMDMHEREAAPKESYRAEREDAAPGGKQERGKVVNIQATAQLQVVLAKPEKFEEVRGIADNLNEKRTVVLNLESVSKDVARRLIDFLTGVAYANNGQIKRVANSTFIITPYNVNVSGDLIDELENSGMFFQS